MIDLSVRLTDASPMSAPASSSASSPAVDSSSFESELSEALSQALSELGIDPSSVQVSINGSSSQTAATSQNSAATPNSTPATPSSTPAVPSTTPASATSPSWSTKTDYDDAYWAAQPPAVQQLRNISDPTQRAATAMQLATEGYTIDYPIMVEGWDPQIATQIREAAGYTWVPSALQQPVEVAPGLTFPGLTTYDPKNPPPGSIMVG